ncbi:MAG: hypothetical protein COA96_11460 [SAR86 cluster bacterium]|uniref:Uncharacterized protein n=1 Tax=SAR86 cluster bacterium TaxID=2030880 RepID=A0A2A5AWD6_9GAMM|nr:MAG: hypothetical protein COA96_11460 [SAR86 cluster bacterium]
MSGQHNWGLRINHDKFNEKHELFPKHWQTLLLYYYLGVFSSKVARSGLIASFAGTDFLVNL